VFLAGRGGRFFTMNGVAAKNLFLFCRFRRAERFENKDCAQRASMSKWRIGLEDRPYESSFSKAVLI